jgi:dTMP kinase
MRLLIDGPDLSGKTTLVNLLRARLEGLGWNVVCHKGRRHPTPVSRLLVKISPNRHPDSAALNAAYILESLLDHFYEKPVPENTVLITEGYVDRSIAYGLARQLSWPCRLALRARRFFPSFDLAILVVADLKTRSARLAQRKNPSEIDRRSIDAHHRFLAAYRTVFRRHANRLIIDTSKVGIDAAVELSLARAMDTVGGWATASEGLDRRAPADRMPGLLAPGTISAHEEHRLAEGGGFLTNAPKPRPRPQPEADLDATKGLT